MVDVMVGADNRKRLTPVAVCRVLAMLSVLFMSAGLIDMGLAIVPVNLQNAAWRFGVGVGIIAGLPILVLGLTIFALASAMLGRTWAVGLATVLAGLFVLGIGALFATVLASVPDLLAAAPAADHLGIRKSAIRAVILAVLYGSVLAGVLAFGVGRLRQGVDS